MYRCKVCGGQVAAGVSRQLITKTEPCEHPSRWIQVWSKKKKQWFPVCIDFGGKGTRITEEIPVCLKCKV